MCHLIKGDMGCHSNSDAPSLCWCLCYCFAGVFPLIALAYLPILCWHLCTCCYFIFVLAALVGVNIFVALVFLLLLHWSCHPYCSGIIALVALAFLPAFCTGVNCPHCADVVIIILLALSSKAHIAMVSLPLSHCVYWYARPPSSVHCCPCELFQACFHNDCSHTSQTPIWIALNLIVMFNTFLCYSVIN